MEVVEPFESLLPALVVESDPLVRRAVSALTTRAIGGRVVSVVDTPAALSALDQQPFGLVLFDSPNAGLLGAVGERQPSAATILLVSELHPRAIVDAVRRGVSGVISRHGDPYQLVSRIRAAYAGGLYLDEQARDALLSGDLGPGTPALSVRERQVLAALAQGQNLLGTARSLGMGLSTVKSHAAKAAAKLGTNSSHRAAVLARDLGLLEEDGLRLVAG